MYATRITQIDRYTFRQVFVATLVVTGGVVALTWLMQSLRFVELVVNRGLSIGVFLRLTGLLIPGFVSVILPITCFVAVLFTYQRLAGDRELTVMRAAGLSPLAIARAGLLVTAIAVGAGYALTLWLVPVSQTAFREFQFEIRNRMAAFLLQEGVFTPVTDDLLVYIRSREQDGTLLGILVDDDRQPAHRATILAERGRLLDGPGAPRVLLMNGSREEIDQHTGQLNIATFNEYLFDMDEATHAEAQRLQEVGEMSLSGLLHPTPAIANPRDFPRMLVEAHKRLSSPLATASFVMIALVSVLSGTFRRHGGIVRPLVAIMVVVGLEAAGLAVDSLAVRETALIPLVWLHAALPGVLCAVYLFRPSLRGRAYAPTGLLHGAR
ncbi:MAG TPA: LPS export ABC transporter permease LptF [Acetobacteraceae bacterium]|jgi:lipopolysaccharide export system permease protein